MLAMVLRGFTRTDNGATVRRGSKIDAPLDYIVEWARLKLVMPLAKQERAKPGPWMAAGMGAKCSALPAARV